MFSDWEDIAAPAGQGNCNVRLADNTHPLDFRIGRDHRGRYVFQLDAENLAETAMEMPRITGLQCELEPACNDRSRLVLVLNHASDFRNFALMCSGLMLATADLTPEQSYAGLLRSVEELHRWQEMLRRRGDKLLSRGERIGLVGELLFLRDVLAKRHGFAAAVRSWNGPEGHEQDFVVAGTIFEVKTQIVTADRMIRISSEDQLDPVQGRIVIANQGLAPLPAAEPGGCTLNSLIAEVRQAVAGSGTGSADILEIALLKAGYEERPEYDDESWILVDRAFYQVAGEFPRIERSDLRPGVEKVSYSIRVADCTAYAISADEAFERAPR